MTTEMNLSIGIEKYIEHLAALGKKPSTIGTAKRTMALLQQHLGDSKVISKILTVHVANFYSSDAAHGGSGVHQASSSHNDTHPAASRMHRDSH